MFPSEFTCDAHTAGDEKHEEATAPSKKRIKPSTANQGDIQTGRPVNNGKRVAVAGPDMMGVRKKKATATTTAAAAAEGKTAGVEGGGAVMVQ